ncbi:MAG: ABC transporter substrate-binding protein [Acetanaerobacterium sp.]
MKKTLSAILVLSLAIAMVFTGCAPAQAPAPTSSAPTPSTPASSVSSSTKLVVYSGLSEDDMTALSTSYKEATGNDMEYIVGNVGDLTARVEAEKANPQADILLGGSVDLYDPLGKNGDFEAYSSPENKALDTRFNDPAGFWQGWYMGVLCILYNPARFNEEIASKGIAAPKTWDDLLDAGYQDEFLMGDPSTAGGARIFVADQIFRLGETGAWDYLKALDKNVNYYTPGAITNIDLIGKGEFIIGMSWAHDTYKAKAAGQPIEIVIPPDTAYEIGGAAIIKDAENMDNAKGFIDWILSKDCQELNTGLSYRYPVRTDVAAPDGLPSLSDVKLVDYDRAKAGSMMDTIKSTFQSEITDKRAQ